MPAEEQATVGSPTTSETTITNLVKSRTAMVWTHLMRGFGWRLNLVKPTLYESNLFDEASIEGSTLRSYLSWRRSQLMLSAPILLSAAVTGLMRVQKISEALTDVGNFLHNLPNIANCILLIAAVGAVGFSKGRGSLRVWHRFRLSSKIIRVGWIISFILPIIPAIIPLNSLVRDSSDVAAAAVDTISIDTGYVGMGYMAIINFLSILPVLVSFPSALMAGSLRIRGLLPDSTLSSWVLTSTAPFHSIITLAATALIVQVAGDAILMVGLLIRCIYPWLYVIQRGLYVKTPCEVREKKVGINQKIIVVMHIVSMGLIITWMFTAEILDTGRKTYYARFILETWGRTLATTVVFSDVMLRMTTSNWRVEKSMNNMDDLYESIETHIRKEGSLKDDSANATKTDTSAAPDVESMEQNDANLSSVKLYE